MSTLLIKNVDTLVSCDAQDHVYTNVKMGLSNPLEIISLILLILSLTERA